MLILRQTQSENCRQTYTTSKAPIIRQCVQHDDWHNAALLFQRCDYERTWQISSSVKSVATNSFLVGMSTPYTFGNRTGGEALAKYTYTGGQTVTLTSAQFHSLYRTLSSVVHTCSCRAGTERQQVHTARSARSASTQTCITSSTYTQCKVWQLAKECTLLYGFLCELRTCVQASDHAHSMHLELYHSCKCI